MKLNRLRIVVSICFCSSLVGFCAEGQTCLSTWTVVPDQFSFGAVRQEATTLVECLALCEYFSDCLAVDYNTAESPSCWTHTNPDFLTAENIYPSTSATQYQINRTCTTPSTDCLLAWNRRAQTHSLNAIETSYWTEYDCFSFCRYTSGCVAVDFDPAGSPPCWMHTNYDDLSPENTYDDSVTAVQYQMNKTCPRPNTTVSEVGRCVGQSFQDIVRCPAGYEIHVEEASYKLHPLCCYNLRDDGTDVPDFGGSPIALNVFDMGDSDYISEIEACEGNSSCSLTSKAYASDGVNNAYCSHLMHRTNYVLLKYTCSKRGHSDPTTIRNPTIFSIPQVGFTQLQDTGTHRATSMPVDGQGNSATTAALNGPQPQSSSSSRDYVVLAGFGVALGALSLLIIIIVGALWCWRKRQEEKRVSNHISMYPMYTNSSTTLTDNNMNDLNNMNNGRYSEQRKGTTRLDYPEGVTASNA